MKFIINPPEFYPYLPDNSFGCHVPFSKIEIHTDGHITLCCAEFMPAAAGNILTDTVDEILENVTRTAVLENMLAGEFSHCNDKCPALATYLTTNKKRYILKPIEVLRELAKKKIFTIVLTYDRSCNLQCPSCRNNLILYKLTDLSPDAVRVAAIHAKAVALITALKDRGYDILLNITGSGDPFASPLFWNYLQELSTQQLPDNFRIHLSTNGILMTKYSWEKIRPLLKHIDMISVSIDAAKEDTYNKIRKNGNFSRLKSNLNIVDDMAINREFGSNFKCNTNYVVQSGNYQEIKEYAAWMLSYKSMSSIVFSLVENWRHWSADEFEQMRNMPGLSAIITDPIFNNPRIFLGIVSSF